MSPEPQLWSPPITESDVTDNCPCKWTFDPLMIEPLTERLDPPTSRPPISPSCLAETDEPSLVNPVIEEGPPTVSPPLV